MFLVHIAPIQKRGYKQLTYFSSSEVPEGSLVQVPIRNKVVPALVLGCEDAKTLKSVLRTNVYETKKLPKQKPVPFYSPTFIQAATETALYFATTIGAVLESYTPTSIYSNSIACVPPFPADIAKKANKNKFKKHVLQLPQIDRIQKYKILIRSSFAKKESVFLCVPTAREARRFAQQYSHGIEKYIFVLDSTHSAKKQQQQWNAVLHEKHAVVIIATPLFLSIPRVDIGTYIIEHEMSSSYKQQNTPYIDARILIEYTAAKNKCTLIYSGTTISTKVHKSRLEGATQEFDEPARTLRIANSVTLVDTTVVRTAAKENKKEFPVLTPEVLQAIQNGIRNKTHSFVFAARRGIATQTVCNDCNAFVTCPNCTSSLVLHEHRAHREMLCHRCGYSHTADIRCKNCDSWNLVPLGIGIQRIQNYIQKYIPSASIFIISSDATKTPVQAKKVIDAFYDTHGAVLIGTEMAISYLTKAVTNTIISSVDSLLCIPDFRIEEKLFDIIATLRECTKKDILIETSTVQNAMLGHATRGALSDYAESELLLRKQLHFPPYAHFIQISCVGTREKVIADMKAFIVATKEYAPRVFRGFIPKGHNTELRALIRIPSPNWPDKKLSMILASVPRSCVITIDPEHML